MKHKKLWKVLIKYDHNQRGHKELTSFTATDDMAYHNALIEGWFKTKRGAENNS